MRKNSHYHKASDKVYIEISANTNTLKSEMIIKDNYEVDLRRYNSSNSLVGYHRVVMYTSGFNESENMVNILTINSIPVNIDIISIYSFFPDVSPGYKIIENPYNLLYLPITSDTIHSITVWLTDQNGDELNLRGETLSMRRYLREI